MISKFMTKTVYGAQQNLGTRIGGEGLGPFAQVSNAVEGLKNFTSAISSIIGVMTIAAGIWFIFYFITGGIQWLTSGGDKHALEQARNKITNAFIGLIIVVSSITILSLASVFLEFDFLITNPNAVIDMLFPVQNPEPIIPFGGNPIMTR